MYTYYNIIYIKKLTNMLVKYPSCITYLLSVICINLLSFCIISNILYCIVVAT